MGAPFFELCDASVILGGTRVLDGLTLSIRAGEHTAILGPNGAGKSTLLRALSRVLPPKSGRVLLDERDLYREVDARTSARSIAFVPQELPMAFEFTCHEIVLMGRAPHLGWFGDESVRDHEIVRRSMERTETWGLRSRPVTELSGGERRRVALARALAQEPHLLLLDEPTTHLDLGHQVQTMGLLRELDCAVVAVLHDLNLAAAGCTRVILLDRGRIVSTGTPESVLTRKNLESVFRTPVTLEKRNGSLLILPRIP